MTDKVPKEVSEYFSELGKKSAAKRAKLTPRQRSEIAMKAWETKRAKVKVDDMEYEG